MKQGYYEFGEEAMQKTSTHFAELDKVKNKFWQYFGYKVILKK